MASSNKCYNSRIVSSKDDALTRLKLYIRQNGMLSMMKTLDAPEVCVKAYELLLDVDIDVDGEIDDECVVEFFSDGISFSVRICLSPWNLTSGRYTEIVVLSYFPKHVENLTTGAVFVGLNCCVA